MSHQNQRLIKISLSFLSLLLLASLSFGLGRLSVLEERREPVRIEYDFSVVDLDPDGQVPDMTVEIDSGQGTVVGSRNSDVYHLPWCSGAQRIGEENLVVFNSRAEAEAAGYRPAGNCPGL